MMDGIVATMVFLLFISLSSVGAGRAEIEIPLGSLLDPNSTTHPNSWRSPSGLFAFGFYDEEGQGSGFAVGIWLVGVNNKNNTVVWTANRDDPPVTSKAQLRLTLDGLLLQTEQGQAKLIANASETASSASMLDSGNFVLYNNDSSVIWQSFDYPTDTILGDQILRSGGQLVSSSSSETNRSTGRFHSSGHFYVSMQYDGNLVAYPVNSSGNPEDAYWHTGTSGSDFEQLSLNIEGFLCLNDNISDFQCLANSTNLRKKSQNTASIYRATLDVDGNFRLYAHQFEGSTSSGAQILWQALSDECQIKGICGFNSYCSNNMSGNAVCECFPGFVPSKYSSRNLFLECKQNYSKNDCESSKDPMMLYHVTSLEDTSLGDVPHLVQPMEMEACEKFCQQDCDCGAVLYTNGSCYKYRLPLRYGRINPNASNTAFFKVSSGEALVDNKRRLIKILAYTLGSISFFCLVIAVSIFFTYKRQVYRYKTLPTNADLGFTQECSLRSFSFDELVKSTGGFREEVGRGSFGAVYRGIIGDSGRRIAVKRLERIVDEGEREFRAEITAIARTYHRNLIKLIGFCIDGSRKLLVYEYLSNGSLANLLFKSEMRLSFKDRLKIALDVARGVQYLHEECEARIIHCNIKPQNILMDEAWTAKISEFGLARLLKPDHSRTKAGDEGTSQYLAPEWKKEASVSVELDIYSYGVVLLEIVCRRSYIDANVSSAEEILLSSWVYQCFVARQLNKLVADDADEDVDWKTLERMVKVGLWCVQDIPFLRPSMKNVILMLEGSKDIPIPPSPAHFG